MGLGLNQLVLLFLDLGTGRGGQIGDSSNFVDVSVSKLLQLEGLAYWNSHIM